MIGQQRGDDGRCTINLLYRHLAAARDYNIEHAAHGRREVTFWQQGQDAIPGRVAKQGRCQMSKWFTHALERAPASHE